MSTSSRLAVATHIMALLAQQQQEPLTSEYIAGSANTNPVVIRRLLGALREAGLVTSQGGNGGGWRLVGDPAQITLRQIYRAVEEDEPFALHHRPPNPQCPVGREITQVLIGEFARAAEALEAQLERTSIATILRQVLQPVE